MSVQRSLSLAKRILFLILIFTKSSESNVTKNSTVNGTDVEGVIRLLTILPYPLHPNDSVSLRPYWDGGLALLPAAQLAVEHVNQDPDTLPGYRVELVDVDGGCDIFSKALMNFAEHVLHGPPIAGIVGPGCDHSALAIASILGREETALPNVHLATSPLLGDRNKYNNSYGIRGLSHALVKTAICLIDHNKWERVAALYDSETYIHLDRELRALIARELVKNRVVFLSEVYDTYLPIDSLVNNSVRVIFLFASPPRALRLLCIAYKKGIVFPNYQWVIVGYHFNEIFAALSDTVFRYGKDFYNCSSNEAILQNNLLISHRLVTLDKDSVLASGHTYHDIRHHYLQKLLDFNVRNMTSMKPNILAAVTYDAVWALLMAMNITVSTFNGSINLTSFSFGNEVFTDEIKLNLDKIEFHGASGFVNFTDGSGYTSRIVDIIHINGSMGNLVGFFNGGDISIMTNNSQNLIFINTTVISRTETVHPSVATLFLLIIISLSVGTLLLHILSTIKRKHPSIKASSPLLNHFIFTGCYIWTAASIIYIIVLKALSSENEQIYANCCHAVFAWLLPVGWTLIFGTLIAKTWRIYKIFIHFRDPGHLISNKVLITFVLLQLGLDIVLGTLWSILSPAQLQKTYRSATGNPHSSITTGTHSVQRTCVFTDSGILSHLLWIVIVLSYKALQVIALLTLTLLTKNIKNLKFSTFLLRKASYLAFISFLSLLPPFVVLWYFNAEVHIDFVLLCTFISGTIFTSFTFVLLPPALPILKQ